MSGAPDPGPGRRPAPGTAGEAHPVRTVIIDIVAPIIVYYGARGLGAPVWIALLAGGAVPSAGVLAGLLARRRVDAMGILVLAALAVSAMLSLVSGSPRALAARDGVTTAAWAAYLGLSVLAARPATFVVSRPLLEGRRVFDQGTRAWVRPAPVSWDELWEREPRFRRIWRVCTVIWASALLADAIARIATAWTLPIGLIPALGGALWPVTFIVLQVITNVYFARSGFWRILRTGGAGPAGPGGEAERHSGPVTFGYMPNDPALSPPSPDS